ncbi:hypothetical protein BT96DRAFT_934445 [Gymnopus androsaceus JB14]|uniref:F-box domain-containing protein n=1 Tax=Gymnopus androsaceus JB14 TaxID=1447944 RepID=A0A6A4IA20_9AGAR|nr:hypothetical protein BT96DRAFT_934445 [Gymnopus androsaceus JB14]
MFVGILQQCKQLVNLEIHLPSNGFIGLRTRPLILLPTLRSLEVICSNAADNILRCFTTPLLQQLSLRYDSQDLDSLVTDLTAFQQRSSTPLSSLKLHILCCADYEVEIITEKVIEILSLFPAIHSLEIHPSFTPDLLIQAMTCTEGQLALPNLKELVLDGYPNYYLTGKDYCLSGSGFKAMVLSRWWPDGDGSASFRNVLSRLQKVTLRGFRVSDLAGDITHVSALSGLVLDYTPVKEWW